MIRVETVGSYWEVDLDLGRYRRFPKVEGARERPEWSDERAGALQDFVWHPLADSEAPTALGEGAPVVFVTYGWRARHVAERVLVLRCPIDEEDERNVVAPNPVVLRGELPTWP